MISYTRFAYGTYGTRKRECREELHFDTCRTRVFIGPWRQGLKLCVVQHTSCNTKLKSVLWFYSLYYDICF
jgi:hypothetical protein